MSFMPGIGSESPPRAVERMVEQVAIKHPAGDTWTNREKRALMLILYEGRVSTMLWYHRLLTIENEEWFKTLCCWGSPRAVIATLKHWSPNVVEAAWLAAPDETSRELVLPNVLGNYKQIVMRRLLVEALRPLREHLGRPMAARTFASWKRPARRGKPRNLVNVIDQLVSVIPKGYRTFRRRLQAIRSSAAHSAPEQMSILWYQVKDTLAQNVVDHPVPAWQARLVRIFNGDANERWVWHPEDDDAAP